MENLEKSKVLWIDHNIDNDENKYTYDEFANSLPEFEIIKCKYVKEAFNFIEENYKNFKFKLFYVIVSGTLSEEFFNEYVKKTLELHILCATIIYCSEKNRKLNEFKPFYLDNFLNPGKVTDSSYFVIEYIKSIECQYYINSSGLCGYKKKEKEKENEKNKNEGEMAAEFTYVNDLGTMSYPIIISKYINCTLIEKEDFEAFQEKFVKSYPKLKHLFKPSQEKNIFIPYHILAKYYLYAYTIESDFYVIMNKELRERKFDEYKIFIYLMYNALNKGVFKSYAESNLYRGGTLSLEEFDSLMNKFNKQKNSESKMNKIFFFSRKFLSFSKKEETANYFLQTAIICNYKGVYVRFIVEGIEDSDFFVTNIDINSMKLSAYSEEEEVLFLPLSCFEVINIETEDFFGNEIKVIKLSYLNKYKEIINKNHEEILKEKDGVKLNKFIQDGINSKYSKGICKYFGYDFNKFFCDEISRKINVELNYQPHIFFQYKNSNPLGKKFVISKKFEKLLKSKNNADELLRNAEKLLDNLNTKISSYQFVSYKGKSCIACFDKNKKLLYLDDGGNVHVPSLNDNLEICNNQELCQKECIPESDIFDAEGFTLGRFIKFFSKFLKKNKNNKEKLEQNQFNKCYKLKNKKIAYKQSGAIEANMVGNALGHFLANYDQFKKASYGEKINILKDTAIPFATLLGRKIIEKIPIFKNTVIGTIFRKGFIIFSTFELCRDILGVFFSDILNTKEKLVIAGKKVLSILADISISSLGQSLAMKLALSLGFVTGPGAIIIGGLVGIGVGYISSKITNKINENEIKRDLIFYSDSLYFKYVPKKYREYAIPTLKWENPPLTSKSFVIELIIDENGKDPYWVVINIPAKRKEMEISELSHEGETIVKYRGLPENAFSGTFCLYSFNITKINYEEFIEMKDGSDKGESLRAHLIDFKMLVVS